VLEPARRGVAVHPGADHVAQHRAFRTAVDCSIDRPGHGWWQRNEHDFAAFAADPQDSVAVLLAQVADTRAAGFEDAQPEQAEQRSDLLG